MFQSVPFSREFFFFFLIAGVFPFDRWVAGFFNALGRLPHVGIRSWGFSPNSLHCFFIQIVKERLNVFLTPFIA
jgi:hypothetical protein